jgi:hypothetical protein
MTGLNHKVAVLCNNALTYACIGAMLNVAEHACSADGGYRPQSRETQGQESHQNKEEGALPDPESSGMSDQASGCRGSVA